MSEVGCPSGGAPAVRCARLVVPQCQGFGYDETIWPEAVQKKRALDNQDRLINYTAPDGKCRKIWLRMDCEKLFPPCRDGNMWFKCRHRCFKDWQTCGAINGSFDAACRKFPEGDGVSDYCPLTHWQAFDEWLKAPSTPAGQPTGHVIMVDSNAAPSLLMFRTYLRGSTSLLLSATSNIVNSLGKIIRVIVTMMTTVD